MSNGPVLISVNSTGQKANDNSYSTSASIDGRYSILSSDATNLSGIDSPGRSNFLHDTVEGWTILIDIGPGGQAAASTSEWRGQAIFNPSEPLEIAFTSQGFGDGFNLYYRDIEAGQTVKIANDISKIDYIQTVGGLTWHFLNAHFAPDGERIAYASSNTSIVPNDTNGRVDIFYEDIDTSAVLRVSQAQNGTAGNGDSFRPIVSPDGKFIAFNSYATNLGPTDTNNRIDIYLKDIETGEVRMVTAGLNGASSNHDSFLQGVSEDGRYILFDSRASNLVEDDTNGRMDVFVYDLLTGETKRISQREDGTAGNDDSLFASFVPGTDIVSFVTYANNLLLGDSNGVRDVVYTRMGSGVFETLDFNGPIQPNNDVLSAYASRDGNYAFLTTEATNLVPGDKDTIVDVVRVPLSQVLVAASIRGGPEDDELVGTERDDYILGFQGDDLIRGSVGSDLIDGGENADTVFYQLLRAQVGKARGEAGEILITKPGDDVDTLLSIERIELIDGSYIFDVSGINADFTYRMYTAAYFRTPDDGGFRYWTGVMDRPELGGDGNLSYSDKLVLAREFLKADEFKLIYGGPNPTNEHYVELMYENVLRREFDQEGRDYWLGRMEDGAGRDEILTVFVDSLENLTNTVADRMDGFWVL